MNINLKNPVEPSSDDAASLTGEDRVRYVDAQTTMSDATSYTGANDQPSFLNYMKKVENASIINKTPKSFRHSSPEGGLDTVGFGHKLTAEEQKTNTIYGYNIDNLTTEQVNDIFQQDINKAEEILIKNYGDKYNNLDDRRKQMLIDFQFNGGSKMVKKFKKFRTAIFNGDEETMKKEYIRFFTDTKGSTKSLARNKDFADYFFN
jgi:GH24 family phage-related lysozyme (muramidase)